MTQNTIQWSNAMDPTKWDSEIEKAKVTTCLNRFEVLASSKEMHSDVMRKWAHERLDEWLDKR
jgi:hypothetical protein